MWSDDGCAWYGCEAADVRAGVEVAGDCHNDRTCRANALVSQAVRNAQGIVSCKGC